MVCMNRVGGKLLRALQSFYKDNRMSVTVQREKSERSESNVGLRLECMMSPWLLYFIVCIIFFCIIITSDRELMFLVEFVCLIVYLSIC